jgi:hypothetical protein
MCVLNYVCDVCVCVCVCVCACVCVCVCEYTHRHSTYLKDLKLKNENGAWCNVLPLLSLACRSSIDESSEHRAYSYLGIFGHSNAPTRDKNTKRHTIRELAGKNELPLIAFAHELHGFGPSSHNLSSLVPLAILPWLV